MLGGVRNNPGRRTLLERRHRRNGAPIMAGRLMSLSKLKSVVLTYAEGVNR